MINSIRRHGVLFLAMLALAYLMAAFGCARRSEKRTNYTLHGTIQAIKESEHKVTLKHDRIEGFMAAMTMDCGVAPPMVLEKLNPGDEIVATIYPGDDTLYNIRLIRIDDRFE